MDVVGEKWTLSGKSGASLEKHAVCPEFFCAITEYDSRGDHNHILVSFYNINCCSNGALHKLKGIISVNGLVQSLDMDRYV